MEKIKYEITISLFYKIFEYKLLNYYKLLQRFNQVKLFFSKIA